MARTGFHLAKTDFKRTNSTDGEERSNHRVFMNVMYVVLSALNVIEYIMLAVGLCRFLENATIWNMSLWKKVGAQIWKRSKDHKIVTSTVVLSLLGFTLVSLMVTICGILHILNSTEHNSKKVMGIVYHSLTIIVQIFTFAICGVFAATAVTVGVIWFDIDLNELSDNTISLPDSLGQSQVLPDFQNAAIIGARYSHEYSQRSKAVAPLTDIFEAWFVIQDPLHTCSLCRCHICISAMDTWKN